LFPIITGTFGETHILKKEERNFKMLGAFGLRRQSSSVLTWSLQQTRLATKKAGGSTRNGRDSPGQRLGVKKFGGEEVVPGNIIIRQRGQKYHAGEMTKMGRDHTIYATSPGYVRFIYNKAKKHQIVTVSPNI
jgi:large subunit ribosomal protein L27